MSTADEQSAMSTMGDHYETMGRILTHLVNHGLGRIDIEPSEAFEIMASSKGGEDEVMKTFSDVLHWMHEEGLIRVASVQGVTDTADVFNGVQLTSRGIAIIQANPDDPELGESIEKKVTDAKGGLEPTHFTKIGAFVGGALASFTKTISG